MNFSGLGSVISFWLPLATVELSAHGRSLSMLEHYGWGYDMERLGCTTAKAEVKYVCSGSVHPLEGGVCEYNEMELES